MATLKQGEKDYLEEHSKEKVAFYEKYLDNYLSVLLNTQYVQAINIYDIFCGIGIYEGDGSKGSPIVAMELINSHLKNKNKPVRLLINDGDKTRVNIAKKHIEQHCNPECGFLAYNFQAKEIFPLVIDKIKASQQDESHLIFIDPHGYKDIYKKDIRNIMEAGKSEILIFLPVHMMYRFLKPSRVDKENKSYAPLQRFMSEFGLEHNFSSINEYIKHIKESFSFDNTYYTVHYTLQAKNKNHYALFFITKHVRGLEKAVNTKWKLDKICGSGFKASKHRSLFEEEENETKKENCLDNFRDSMVEYLQTERTNNEIYLFALKNGFLIKDTNDILRELSKNNKLVFDRQIRKNSFYLTYENYKKNIIRYKVKVSE